MITWLMEVGVGSSFWFPCPSLFGNGSLNSSLHFFLLVHKIYCKWCWFFSLIFYMVIDCLNNHISTCPGRKVVYSWTYCWNCNRTQFVLLCLLQNTDYGLSQHRFCLCDIFGWWFALQTWSHYVNNFLARQVPSTCYHSFSSPQRSVFCFVIIALSVFLAHHILRSPMPAHHNVVTWYLLRWQQRPLETCRDQQSTLKCLHLAWDVLTLSFFVLLLVVFHPGEKIYKMKNKNFK